ncbi:hypothetical protein HGM15179_022154 [Zosterops borbonicus]|uniref:Uncharacterized protein n=1 Tax=Zosterops borbonicus TaxID=364589 RepID=A0A8K1D3Q8_9PASS|nr:hypothetical protein HGM15179_022154 [Zosterops borbonicus]
MEKKSLEIEKKSVGMEKKSLEKMANLWDGENIPWNGEEFFGNREEIFGNGERIFGMENKKIFGIEKKSLETEKKSLGIDNKSLGWRRNLWKTGKNPLGTSLGTIQLRVGHSWNIPTGTIPKIRVPNPQEFRDDPTGLQELRGHLQRVLRVPLSSRGPLGVREPEPGLLPGDSQLLLVDDPVGRQNRPQQGFGLGLVHQPHLTEALPAAA